MKSKKNVFEIGIQIHLEITYIYNLVQGWKNIIFVQIIANNISLGYW